MESYWEDITPDRAAEYLRGNAAGRSVNKNAVEMYARDMAAGRWQSTHQGIALDEDGTLVDGQHRMHAIRKSSTTVRMWVTRGVPPGSFGAFDLGRGRTMADHLTIDGYKHTTQLAALARKVALWEAGMPWQRKITPTHDECTSTLAAHPELTEAAVFAHGWPSRRTLAPAMAGFCWWLFTRIDRDDAEHFMESLRTGSNLDPGDPVLALRERLVGDRHSRDRAGYATGYQRQEVTLALAILAWNHYRKRNKISKLQLPSSLSDESFPRPV